MWFGDDALTVVTDGGAVAPAVISIVPPAPGQPPTQPKVDVAAAPKTMPVTKQQVVITGIPLLAVVLTVGYFLLKKK